MPTSSAMLSLGSSKQAGEVFFYSSVYNWVTTGRSSIYPPEDMLTTTAYQNSSYIWTVPAGVTSICAVAIGGGGSGEGDNVTDGGGGGGGGCLAYVNNFPVVSGEEFEIIVGSGGPIGNVSGQAGVPSCIRNNLTKELVLLAMGGDGGGPAGAAGLGGNTVFPSGYIGGDGSSGTANRGGNGGWAGNLVNNGLTPSLSLDEGGYGSSPYGVLQSGTFYPRRVPRAQILGNGDHGGDYGGGGAGAQDEVTAGGVYYGGSGGDGCVRIIWGPLRSFPMTNCGEEHSLGNITAVDVYNNFVYPVLGG